MSNLVDYASLNHPENKNAKNDLKKIVFLFDLLNIHYWIDFGTLAKITTQKNNKFLYYVNSIDIGVFKESFPAVKKLIFDNNFHVLDDKDFRFSLLTSNGFLTKTYDERLSEEYPVFDGLLKWINIWSYKTIDNNLVTIGLKNDFVYNKELFSITETVDYEGVKVKIPKYFDVIEKIRYPNVRGEIFCRSPKKRAEKEKKFHFVNFGDYK
jgi:hypothetical protein